jgi:nicotinamidase-related amidase
MFVDFQPQMFFATASEQRELIMNSVLGLARATTVFDVPVVLSSVSADGFAGPVMAELVDQLAKAENIDRTTMDAWEDERVVAAVKKTGRSKIVIAGLWTEVCVVMPVLCALDQGYEVYVVADACGGVTRQAHEHAMERMRAAGAMPVTWLQVMLELQRDWARTDTYSGVMDVVKAHGGAYGQGVVYADRFVGAQSG